jgi:hypothetical protein
MSKANMKHARALVDKFKDLYRALDHASCYKGLIEGVYEEDMVFQDSFHRIEGVDAFKNYCAGLYENLNYCEFEFHKEWIGNDDAMLTWTMSYSHPRLKGSKKIQVLGATELVFRDKVVYHKDYFDGGELLYEHVPVLGTVISQLKKRMG